MSQAMKGTVQYQKFLEERYVRETDARLAWFKQSKGSDDEKPTSKQYEVFKKKIESACPKPTESLLKLRHLKARNHHRRRANYDGNIEQLKSNLKPVDKSLLVNMYPVPEVDKKLLYDGFTKEGKGRHQYLNHRYHTAIPEDKYQFPIVSSWDYGWRLGDVTDKNLIGKPPFCRTRIVADTFYSRNGIPTLQSATF